MALVVTHKQGLALSSTALERAFYDGHTLKDSLNKSTSISGVRPKRSFVDRGYRGHGFEEETQVYISGQRRGMTRSLKKALKRRSAIEPHIGHMKADGKLGRNYLKGIGGAKMNAILCAIGHNLRLILNQLRIFFAFILSLIFLALSKSNQSLNKWKLLEN